MSKAVPLEPTCKELVELVTDLFEDRLSIAENGWFELHIHRCTGCRVYVGQMRALVRAAGRLAEADVPATTCEGVLRMFREWSRTGAAAAGV